MDGVQQDLERLEVIAQDENIQDGDHLRLVTVATKTLCIQLVVRLHYDDDYVSLTRELLI